MERTPGLSAVLRKGTLLFLALPQIVFFFGWMRLPVAVVVCVCLGVAVWRAGFCSQTVPGRENGLKWLAAVGLPALVLTLCSGAGGWGGGDSDWLKHDTLLRDLVARPWPVSYQTDHGPVLLVYYLAFYLPAALVGKLTGCWLAGQTLALTTWVGLVLSAGWLVALGRPRSGGFGPVWLGAVVFFGFSGLDPLGKVLVNLHERLPASYGDWSDVEWWAQFAQYSSNAAAVFWAPQHAFGGWLPAALVIEDWLAGQHRLEGSWVLYVACALPWSPFAALGLAALIGGLLLWRWVGERERGGWRRCLTWTNAGGAAAAAGFALYLLAHFQSYDLPEAYRVAPGHHPVPLLEQSHLPWIVLYLFFVAIEFGGFSLVLMFALCRRGTGPAADALLLAVATLVLMALPWFHYGFANDLVMRGGVPALFALQVLIVRLLAGAVPLPRGRRWPVVAVGCLLLGGAVNVGLEYRRHLTRIVAQGSLRDVRAAQPVRSLAELQRTVYARPGFDFSRQYLGSADSFFARHLARRGFIPPTPPPPGDPVDF